MFRTPVALVGLAGVVFLVSGFVPASLSVVPPAQSKQMPVSAKGDRMAAPAPGGNPATVSIVELIGVDNATVILRDRDGSVLYRSDPRSGLTTFSKDTELPVITLKEEAQGPAVQHPVRRQQEGNEAPREQKQKRRSPVGCMGDVSPLAKASADRMPSLCLALLDKKLS